MCSVMGYDGERGGFLSGNQPKRETPDATTQTSLFSSMSSGSQTSFYVMNEVHTKVNQTDDHLLQKIITVFPDDVLNDVTEDSNSEMIVIKTVRIQKIEFPTDEESTVAAGDQLDKSVLSMTWSCDGNSLAVLCGQQRDEDCKHGGLIKLYSVQQSNYYSMCHVCDIKESNQITALEFHPDVSGLLAFGTVTGDVIVKDISNVSKDHVSTMPKLILSNHHSSKISYIKWADKRLASKLLWFWNNGPTKNQNESDLVLITSGFSGLINIWQVNLNLNILKKVVGFCVNGSHLKRDLPDITCFDFNDNDSFVVGSKDGQLISCRTNFTALISDCENFDPAVQTFETNSSSILKIAFKSVNPYIFASLNSNSEINLYKLNLSVPLKVICVEGVTTSMEWVPKNPNWLLLSVSNDVQGEQTLKVYDTSTERELQLDGTEGDEGDYAMTAIAVNKSLSDRVAVGTSKGNVYIWKFPLSLLAVSTKESFEMYR